MCGGYVLIVGEGWMVTMVISIVRLSKAGVGEVTNRWWMVYGEGMRKDQDNRDNNRDSLENQESQKTIKIQETIEIRAGTSFERADQSTADTDRRRSPQLSRSTGIPIRRATA